MAEWFDTGASDMQDVATVGGDPESAVGVTGTNGTVWRRSSTGEFTRDTAAAGFARIDVGSAGEVWAVGLNETVWVRRDGTWTQTSASGMVDVSVADDGTVWLAGRNGTIWFSLDDGESFEQDTEASGFARVSATKTTLWAVGVNETVWYKRDGSWNTTTAEGFADVGAGPTSIVYLVGSNGTVWSGGEGRSFVQDTDASNFASIAGGRWGPWAVGRNGSLWHAEAPHVR